MLHLLHLDCQWLVFLLWHFSLHPVYAGSQHRRCWNVLWFHKPGRTTTNLHSMCLLLSWTTYKSSLCSHSTYQRSTLGWKSFSKLTHSKEEVKIVGISCKWHECNRLSHSELSLVSCRWNLLSANMKNVLNLSIANCGGFHFWGREWERDHCFPFSTAWTVLQC